MDELQAAEWLSDQRFQPFLDEAHGDHSLAVTIYEWHLRLSAACFATINGFEVLLRNAIDRQLGMDQSQTPIRNTWLMDFNTLQPNGVKQVIVAVERLEKGKEITRSRVVAGVSFGFWAGLFSKTYEELWRHRLRLAFPNGAVTRKDLTQSMRSIQAFRNRVAHHDCLLNQPVRERYDEMIRISGWIDADAATWLEGQSAVVALLASKP
jgi:Abi-like protein